MRTICASVLATLLFVSVAGASERVPADAAATRQKAVFVENLVTKSVSAKRIEDSGDPSAMAALEAARSLVGEAGKALDAGNVEAADAKLNEALGLVNAEVRRLSETEMTGEHDKRMYERRLNDVRTFLAAYERVAESGASHAAAQAREIRTRVDKATARAGTGDYSGATEILNEAYTIARGDIREMREGKTLIRSLDFATAEEAYEYELGRNASYFELLRFAIAENNPTGSMLQGIERNRSQAEDLRAQAESSASSGKHGDGVKQLAQSTNKLRQAIRMSGLFIP